MGEIFGVFGTASGMVGVVVLSNVDVEGVAGWFLGDEGAVGRLSEVEDLL